MSLNNKQVNDRVNEVRAYCEKTLQAYRIRLECLKRRHDLLQKAGGNFDLANNADFYNSLRNIISKEKQVLKIMESAQKDGFRSVDLVMSELRAVERELNDPQNKEALWLAMRSVSKKSGISELDSPQAITEFLNDMYYFVHEIKHHLHKINSRIEEESRLLSMKIKSKDQFDRFIMTWDAEMKENDKLLTTMKGIISKHSRLFYGAKNVDVSRAVNYAGAGATIAGLGGGFVGLGVLSQALGPRSVGEAVTNTMEPLRQALSNVSPKVAIYCVLGIATAGALGGFIVGLISSQEAVIADIRKDEDVLKEVEKRRNVNTSFFGRMFGRKKNNSQDQNLFER
jgi:hypothetical protein